MTVMFCKKKIILPIQEKRYMRQDCKVKARVGTNYLFQTSSSFIIIITTPPRPGHHPSTFTQPLSATETLNMSDQ